MPPRKSSAAEPQRTCVQCGALLAKPRLLRIAGKPGSGLYTVKECFHGTHAIALTPANLMGVMSLIVWSLTMVVLIKYVVFILKADNEGEGGIYALAALFLGKGAKKVFR